MAVADKGRISARELLDDPLLIRYFPRNFSREILERQLEDKQLLRMDLDELSEMNLEELATCAFSHGLAAESALYPPERDGPPGAQGEPGAGGLGGYSDQEAGCDGRITIQVEGMGVMAKIILHEPKEGEVKPSEAEILRALADHGIVTGIRHDYITRLAERPVYERRFKIAEGKLPVDGEDGKVIFHFDTSVDLVPKICEDGSADYKSLDYVKNVKEGGLLCEIIPPTSGSDGVSIFGETLPGRPGKQVEIGSGANTVLSEDKRRITAACDGQVYLKNKKVLVSRVLVVDQVDTSTGNILFVGSVQVRGDVAGGFTIRAGGDIMVKGVVEDAVLVAGGNIVLCGGIKGKDAGLLDAGGCIRTLFIENANVRAKDSIYADNILNSTVECRQIVSLSGGSGCLIGGKCVAGKSVRAIRIGNAANIATNINIKNMEMLESRKAEVSLKLSRYREAVGNLIRLISISAEGMDDRDTFQVIFARVLITKKRFDRMIDEIEQELKQQEDLNFGGTIMVRETLFPNTLLEIDGAVLRNMAVKHSCTIVKVRGKLEMTSY